MHIHLLLPFVGLLALPLVAGAQIYTWQEADGKHYSDSPPAAAKSPVHTINAESFGDGGHARVTSSHRGNCSTMFDGTRVALVDEVVLYGNLLVRGNFPLDCGDQRGFAFTGLDSRLKELKGSGFDLGEYEIVVVALINNAGNKNDLRAEERVFGLNPDADVKCQNDYQDGTPALYECLDNYRTTPYVSPRPAVAPQELYWWPLWICADGDYDCTNPDTYSYSDLQDLPRHMNDLINAEPPYAGGKKKRLVYFHCEHGCDRTGTVHAAYQMFTRKVSLQEAVNEANQAIRQEGSCMKGGYMALARRYCKHVHPNDDAICK